MIRYPRSQRRRHRRTRKTKNLIQEEVTQKQLLIHARQAEGSKGSIIKALSSNFFRLFLQNCYYRTTTEMIVPSFTAAIVFCSFKSSGKKCSQMTPKTCNTKEKESAKLLKIYNKKRTLELIPLIKPFCYIVQRTILVIAPITG